MMSKMIFFVLVFSSFLGCQTRKKIDSSKVESYEKCEYLSKYHTLKPCEKINLLKEKYNNHISGECFDSIVYDLESLTGISANLIGTFRGLEYSSIYTFYADIWKWKQEMGCKIENDEIKYNKKTFKEPYLLCIDSSGVKKLLKINFKNFIGDEVENFLNHEKVKGDWDYVFFENTPNELAGIIINLKEDIFIRVLVQEYQYMQRYNEEKDWDLKIFKKEKISEIKIFCGSNLIFSTE